jgi:hypothetical protein
MSVVLKSCNVPAPDLKPAPPSLEPPVTTRRLSSVKRLRPVDDPQGRAKTGEQREQRLNADREIVRQEMVQESKSARVASPILQSVGFCIQLVANRTDVADRRCTCRQGAAVAEQERNVPQLKVLPESTDEAVACFLCVQRDFGVAEVVPIGVVHFNFGHPLLALRRSNHDATLARGAAGTWLRGRPGSLAHQAQMAEGVRRDRGKDETAATLPMRYLSTDHDRCVITIVLFS